MGIQTAWSALALPLVTFLALASGNLAAADLPSERHAVLVGINEYAHPNLSKLNYAVRDATELGDLLKVAGYKVSLLTDESADARFKPTKANIDRVLAAVLDGAKKEDAVLLAFAGHGLQFDEQDAYFCPYDARPTADSKESLLSLSNLYSRMEQSFAGTKVMLVDACRSDPTAGRTRGITGDSIKAPAGVAVLFSCAKGQSAFEHEKFRHGVFFHYVMEGLRGEAADKQGRVTFLGLAGYVQDQVPAQVRKLFPDSKPNQTPNFKGDTTAAVVIVAARTTDTLPTAVGPGTKTDMTSVQAAVGKTLDLDIGGGMKMKLVRIKVEGSHPVSTGRQIEKDYYLGATELTQGQWQRVMGTTPWKGKEYVKEGPDFPATYLSSQDAVAFCGRMGRKVGRKVRLPSCAEWQYACRAGTTTRFSFGDDEAVLGDFAWYHQNCSEAGAMYAHQVATKKANPWGLYDMHGNVEERVESTGKDGSSSSAQCGGSWAAGAKYCFTGSNERGADSSNFRTGFRICVETN